MGAAEKAPNQEKTREEQLEALLVAHRTRFG
jgi:hypothetical protein